MKPNQFKFLGDTVRHHAAQRPRKTAMIFGDHETSYGELDQHANRVANALLASGLQHQARIGFLGLNCDRFFELWHGASRAGMVLVPVNFRLAPAEINYILEDASVEILFIGAEFSELVAQLEPGLEKLSAVVTIDDSDTRGKKNWTAWAELLNGQQDTDPRRELSESDTAIQYYSSGTTGFPKGVESSHANILTHTPVWLAENGNWDETDVSLVPMPLFHVAGAAFGSAAFVVGATDVILPVVDPQAILEAIPRFGVTRTCVVPAVIHAMLMNPLCPDTDFSSIRRILYGASPMPESLAKKAIDVMGPCLEQTYGATETGGGMTLLSPGDHLIGDRLRSCGRPMSYVDVRVVDEAGLVCPPGTVGEIVVRGSCVMKAYWGDPQATREAIRDGWYHTADMGYFDEDGFLYVHDRKHDMIVTGGENVYPAEVENAILGHDHVAEAAVFGVPDEEWGEAVKAVVVPASGCIPDEGEIIAYCRQRIAAYKCPKTVETVESIPRNATGKILKKELRAPYWKDRERLVN